ncbi:hypothetical protein DFR65_102305 [Oceanihabitans sediminis]|uniref:DUF3185 family protein n=1 Tax=Oceanihabitans sediminis TaxID=1812012 RepID=A0A368P4Y0_9FLAO|nr:hypothetical protein [Oceanihabitans sediminis]RBP32969.1 hypothetical protein DFR65_102305 [Oceanihabitans sediminis]RCU57513.1 hypothetical protein DU428_06870 [Oceanihabitans sediminis]
MNKSIKTVLLVVGVALLGYGIYTMIAPEASISIGEFGIEAQDNTNAYITIALGIVALIASVFVGKKA